MNFGMTPYFDPTKKNICSKNIKMFFYGQHSVVAAWTEVSFFLSLSLYSFHALLFTHFGGTQEADFYPTRRLCKKTFLLYRGHLWVPSLNKVLRSRLPEPTLVPGVFNIFLYCHLFMNQILWIGPGYRDRTLSVKSRKKPEN